MRHWLWISVALAAGCFSEPEESPGTEDTDSVASTGPGLTTSGPTSGPTAGPTSGPDPSTTGGRPPADSTGGEDASSAPTDASTSSAPPPECGNGEVEGSEHCDGEDPQGAACLDDCTIACLDHFRDCDEIPSGGCEIDTATDANNCGACGHVCSSGICQDSACAPTAMAMGIGNGPTRVARTGDSFVFDESGFGRILRWDLNAGPVQELVPDDLTGGFRRFAVADGSVFWLDYNLAAAQSVPLDGGDPAFLFAIEDGGAPFASDAHLYYPTTSIVDGFQVSTLLRAPLETPAATVTFAEDVSGLMCQVVEAGGRIVYAGTDPNARVQSKPIAGGASQSHAVLSTDVCNRPVFGVATSIYLYGQAIEGGPFGLIRHNIANDTSSMVIPEGGLGDLGDYFVSSDGILADVGGEVRIYDLTGNDPITVADADPNTTGRYLDDEVVVWTEVENNTWTLFLRERPSR